MIRILSMKKQNEIYKKLISIILELRKIPTPEARDALGNAFDIAVMVGGVEMLEAMGGNKVKTHFGQYRHGIVSEVGDSLSKGIELIDDVLSVFDK